MHTFSESSSTHCTLKNSVMYKCAGDALLNVEQSGKQNACSINAWSCLMVDK